MTSRARFAVCLGTAVAAAGSARAEAPLDHRGQVGLAAAAGWATEVEVPHLRREDSRAQDGFRIDLRPTLAIDDAGQEVFALIRLAPAGDALALGAGLRLYGLDESWKTLAEVGLFAPIDPGPALGLRAAVGVQYDPITVLGVFVSAGGSATLGGEVVVGAEAMAGLHARFPP